jgi:hypothetical protein
MCLKAHYEGLNKSKSLTMHIISKSRFVSGLQCKKKLFFDVNRKELKQEPTPEQTGLFTRGNEIGELARQTFPDGRDASFEINGDWSVAINRTQEWIRNGVKTIYEATFSHSKAFAALDILHYTDNECWAIEVKSSAEIKEYHIADAALQYWVMEKCGNTPSKFFIMHINSAYVKQGKIIPKNLFTLTDITEQVKAKQQWVTDELSGFHHLLDNKAEPEISIGKHCKTPFNCDYIHHCWSGIPEKSVFELYSPRGKEWELYNSGVVSLKDISETESLSTRQKLQVQGVKANESYLDKKAISDFLSNFQYPLHFFDFETIFPPVPPINGARPYQQTPFQYSLHILRASDSELEHKEFLAKAEHFKDNSLADPRLLMLEQMKQEIEISGSIVAYNANFEIGVLKSLIPIFPEYRTLIENYCARFVDLLIPFRNAWYYLPQMGGSASIKSVLPAIAPEFSYKDLAVNNGGMASDTFLSMIDGTFNGDVIAKREDLKEYCERDTLGMVILFNHLKSLLA